MYDEDVLVQDPDRPQVERFGDARRSYLQTRHTSLQRDTCIHSYLILLLYGDTAVVIVTLKDVEDFRRLAFKPRRSGLCDSAGLTFYTSLCSCDGSFGYSKPERSL